MRADVVRALNDGARVQDGRAAEQHHRNGDEQRAFVNRGEQFLRRDVDTVCVPDNFDPRAARLLLLVKIEDGWELQVHQHHFVARAGEVEARSDDSLRGSDVLVQRDAAWRRANQRCHFVADGSGEVPPAFFPRADAAGGP